MIYFTSDLHFCHNKSFLFTPRGFDNVEDMNKAIVENWNNIITDEDEIYVLGDLMLNDNVEGMRLLSSLNGKIHIILGNHDTDARLQLYMNVHNIEDMCYSTIIKYNKYHFYLSHYPSLTSSMRDEKPVKHCLINLHGHTHQDVNFLFEENPFIYHVGVDSHNCSPVSVEEVIRDIENKYEELKRSDQ